MAANAITEEQTEEQEQEQIQRDINNIIGNVPMRIESLNGEIIEVRSKSIEEMLLIDDLIYSLEDIGDSTPSFTTEDLDDLSPEELRDKRREISAEIREVNKKIADLEMEIMVRIINTDVENPKFDKAWCYKNISPEIGVKIMDAYDEKCSLGPLIERTMRAKKF